MTDVEVAKKADEDDPPPSTKKAPRSEPEDWGTPKFARGFPEDERLDALVGAFARGDYAAVRTGARAILDDKDVSDEVKRAAKLLVARTEPDPTAKLIFLLAAGLLVFLTAFWLTHDHPESGPSAPPPKPTFEVVN